MGDRLRADKLPLFVTSHSGQLSLLPSAGRKMSNLPVKVRWCKYCKLCKGWAKTEDNAWGHCVWLLTSNEVALIDFVSETAGLSGWWLYRQVAPLAIIWSIYTVSQKTSRLRLAIILTYTTRLVTIIFGSSVTVKVRNHTMLCFPTSPI